MTNDDTTQDEELEDQDLEDDADEDDESPVGEESEEGADDRKLTYEEKLANAADDAERVRIATAEAAKQRRLKVKALKANKKGEEEMETTTTTPEEKPEEQTQPSSDSVDERILLAQGMPKKLLGELKVIAKVRGVSLIDAQTDDLFVAAKEKFEKEKKRREAGSGPSRGSGAHRAGKTLNTPGLSRDEHRRMVSGR